MRRRKLTLPVKFILLIGGISAALSIAGSRNDNNPGLGAVAAGCFIAFALMDNNDVREQNKADGE
jgi:hypothetical protein